jgi:bile acid:Na+ symporter, BASS family
MPVDGPIPQEVLTVVAAATVFSVMFTLGLGIVLAELRGVLERPGLLARALFAVLVAVPAIALGIVRLLSLDRWVEIGIVLMAISPGAPVALRRSLAAGGHRAFAPVLQILLALLAVVTMPLSIAALNLLYAGHAAIEPAQLARQVFFAQLLPLCLGLALRAALPARAVRLEPRLARVAGLLLLALAVLALIDVWQEVVESGLRIAAAIALVTLLALAAGHALGGPDAGTRSATAISSAIRNPGLALLVATLNGAAPAVTRTVLAYLVVSALTVIPYSLWRRRSATLQPDADRTAPRI